MLQHPFSDPVPVEFYGLSFPSNLPKRTPHNNQDPTCNVVSGRPENFCTYLYVVYTDPTYNMDRLGLGLKP